MGSKRESEESLRHRLANKQREIESTKGFRLMEDAFAKAAAKQKEGMHQRYESNGEVQRWRTMTKEEKARDAIDRMTERVKTYNDAREGRDTTAEAARRKAEELAYKSERQKEG